MRLCSFQVQLTLKRLKTLEANEAVAFDEDAPITSKKAAQKLTNFRVSNEGQDSKIKIAPVLVDTHSEAHILMFY